MASPTCKTCFPERPVPIITGRFWWTGAFGLFNDYIVFQCFVYFKEAWINFVVIMLFFNLNIKSITN